MQIAPLPNRKILIAPAANNRQHRHRGISLLRPWHDATLRLARGAPGRPLRTVQGGLARRLIVSPVSNRPLARQSRSRYPPPPFRQARAAPGEGCGHSDFFPPSEDRRRQREHATRSCSLAQFEWWERHDTRSGGWRLSSCGPPERAVRSCRPGNHARAAWPNT
jgi:hypothetical protein